VSQYSHGFMGDNFRGGAEYRFGTIDLRGGARYSQDRWHPTVGAGFNFTPRFGVDVALYAAVANLERRRDPAMAVSLRIGR
jgi:long-subunit fatty acid transport protein